MDARDVDLFLDRDFGVLEVLIRLVLIAPFPVPDVIAFLIVTDFCRAGFESLEWIDDNRKRVGSDQPSVVDTTVTLRSAGDTVVRTATERRVSRDARRSSGGQGVTVDLPLTDVAPGPYVLDVEARVARLDPVRRRIPIRVTGTAAR